MKNQSNKRTALEREYVKAKKRREDMLMDEGKANCCEGCGRNLPTTCSHIIPRSYDITLLAEVDNFRFHCDNCAKNVERGDYDLLLDGEIILSYIEATRPVYAEIKKESYRERHGFEIFK
jgi:hypothetical protein